MRSHRRLLLMVAGLMILCSCNFAWFNYVQPAKASFGLILSTAIADLTGGSVLINIAILNQLSMAAILFSLGVIVLIASVLGSKPIGLVANLLVFLTLLMWLNYAGISLDGFVYGFGQLGAGAHLAIAGLVLSLITILFPRLRHSSDS